MKELDKIIGCVRNAEIDAQEVIVDVNDLKLLVDEIIILKRHISRLKLSLEEERKCKKMIHKLEDFENGRSILQ